MSDIPFTSTAFEVYRKETNNSAGQSKDWAIKVSGESHLTVKHGTTGRRFRTREIKDVNGQHFNAAREIHRRIEMKLRSGYEHIGTFTVHDNGSLTRESFPEKKFWVFTSIRKSELVTVMSELTTNLTQCSVELGVTSESESYLTVELDAASIFMRFQNEHHLPQGGWVFGMDTLEVNPEREIADGEGEIVYPLQIMLINALAFMLDGNSLNALSIRGEEEESLLVEQGDFLNHYKNSVPELLVRLVGRAAGILAKPVPLFAENANKPSTIFF